MPADSVSVLPPCSWLSPEQIREAAAAAHVEPKTVARWVRKVHHHGIKPFLPQDRRVPSLRADVAQLRALAAAEKNPNIRKRIVALTHVAAGMPVYDAAIAARSDPSTVYATMRRFEREGVASLRNKPCLGRRVETRAGGA